MQAFLLLFLAVALLIVAARLFLLRREIANIAKTIHQIHGTHSNQRITVTTQQKQVIALANAVNQLYEDIYEERGRHEQAMEEIRLGMAGISHDLRTPLTSIIGYVQLLREGGNTPEQIQHFLSVVYGKAMLLNRMISSLFELARLESGVHSFELARVDLTEVLSEALVGSYDALTADGKEPEVNLSEQSLWVIGDRDAFSRIFANLLQNMVQHNAEDGRIESRLQDKRVIVTFSNRAGELTENDVAHLFQRFYVADRVRAGEHTGLGLSIVRELVEQMDGEIAADLIENRLVFTLSWKCQIP